MTSPALLEKTMRTTTEHFLDAFNGPRWSLEKAMAPLAPECTHTILDTSLNVPTRNKAELEAWFRDGLGPLITDSTMVITDWKPSPAEHRALAKSSMTAMSPAGPYNNHFAWYLRFSEDGSQIVQIEEDLDADLAKDLLKRLKGAGYLENH